MSHRREDILETSIELFSAKGYLNTSTRHIAEALGISVGNLYYYFSNKEDILIEIFQRYVDDSLKEIRTFNYEDDEKFLLKEFLTGHIKLSAKHQFLHLEFNAIMKNSPRFKTIMRHHVKQEIERFKTMIRHQIRYGYIVALEEAEINHLASNIWILGIHGINFWHLISGVPVENAKRGSLDIFFLLKPYLTQKSRACGEMDEIFSILTQADDNHDS